MDYFFRFPGGCDRAVTLSYDDGVEQDARNIELLKRHGMKGTFNINSGLFHPENTPHPEGTIIPLPGKQDPGDLSQRNR